MRRWNRAFATLVAVAASGFLLWLVPHFDRWDTGGYWAVMGLAAGAGVLLGLSQLHGRDGNPLASFLLAFVPVLVAVGWVLLAAQPHGNWIRDRLFSWSGDMGIRHAVHNLGEHVAVLAFGLGAVFGLTFEPKMIRRSRTRAEPVRTPVVSAPSPSPVAADPGIEKPAVEDAPARPVEGDEQTGIVPPQNTN